MTAKGSSLLRASALMASGTMVSRVLGFARNAMLLAALGSAGGAVSAAFQTANTLPNTVFNLLASGVFDAVLVPQIVRALKRESGDTYVNRLITLAGTILFGVTVLAMIAAPLLIIIMAPGFDAEIRGLAIAFALLCIPQIFFYGLYNLLGELLNARGVFGPYMWAPVLNNVIGIGGLAAFLGIWGSHSERFAVADLTSPQFWLLGASATLGVVCQALVLFLPMKRAGVSFRPDFHFRGTSFGSASKVAGWTFATLGVSQIGVLSTNAIASFADTYLKTHDLPYAGIAGYSTAFLIFMLPQSVITVSLATAIFTRLTHAVADNDEPEVARQYEMGIRVITSLTVLAAAILMACALPMMQMVLVRTTNFETVNSYAWVLIALMPGVASTGIVLMSQRVFFAYEDAKPIFLMGIAPTLLQVAVGWGMYALTGVQWWVVGAALAETACRVFQGLIAMKWVARRNPHVASASIIRSYAIYVVCGAVAFIAGWASLQLMGAFTALPSMAGRFLLAGVKVTVVSLVATAVYMVTMRCVSPRESATTIRPALQRFHVPVFLQNIVAAPALRVSSHPAPSGEHPPVVQGNGHNELSDSVEESDMDRRDDLNTSAPSGDASSADTTGHNPSSDGWIPPEIDLSVPKFDDIFRSDSDSDEAPASSPADAPSASAEDSPVPSEEGAALADTDDVDLSGEESPVEDVPAEDADSDSASADPAEADETDSAEGTEAADSDADELTDVAAHTGSIPVLDPSTEGTSLDATMGMAGVYDADEVADDPELSSENPETHDAPAQDAPTQVVHVDEALTAPEQRPHAAPRMTGIPAPVNVPAPTDPHASPAGNDAPPPRGGIDPTKPTLIGASVLVVVAAFWALSTALSPISDTGLSETLANAQASHQQQQETASAEPEPAPTVAPKISSVSVLSWRNDGGDHEDMAINMLDGKPETTWRSRYFDLNQFQDATAVTIVVKLNQKATVSSVHLSMDSSTSGGQVVVRAVDPKTPREGTELTTSALSPETEIQLPTPVETEAISLTFRSMPTSVDGKAWAWVSELSVK